MAEIRSSAQYWCYHCDKRVSVETLTDLPDVICFECKNGFVESIPQPASPSPPPPPPPPPSTTNQHPYFSNHFLQILRLIAESAHDDDNPPPSPPPAPADSNDFLRIQLDGWNNDRDDDEEDEDEDEINFGNPLENEEQDDGDSRRRRHDLLRLRIRDFAYRASSNNPNRLMDWSDILMGLQSHTMEFRFQMPEYYVGNPEDYVDAAGYEALLQRLVETDGGRRGPPPASKSAVSGLKSVVITDQEEEGVGCCAICKETVAVGEEAKKLPCGHGYHGVCIVTWLGSRNTCPVCRFELPTEDPEYEQQRNKRTSMGPSSSSSSSHGGSSSSGPNNTTSR